MNEQKIVRFKDILSIVETRVSEKWISRFEDLERLFYIYKFLQMLHPLVAGIFFEDLITHFINLIYPKEATAVGEAQLDYDIIAFGKPYQVKYLTKEHYPQVYITFSLASKRSLAPLQQEIINILRDVEKIKDKNKKNELLPKLGVACLNFVNAIFEYFNQGFVINYKGLIIKAEPNALTKIYGLNDKLTPDIISESYFSKEVKRKVDQYNCKYNNGWKLKTYLTAQKFLYLVLSENKYRILDVSGGGTIHYFLDIIIHNQEKYTIKANDIGERLLRFVNSFKNPKKDIVILNLKEFTFKEFESLTKKQIKEFKADLIKQAFNILLSSNIPEIIAEKFPSD